MNLKRGWRLASPTEKRKAEADRPFHAFFQIADLSPESVAAGTFPIYLEKAHKSAHRLQQGHSAVVITLGNGIMKGIGYYSIIVLIVLIVTACLNEAKPFSLFNATQILGIPISENLAVVFIVLIVFIVTGCLY